MENQLQKQLWVISLLLAPLLLVIAQFFWKNGQIDDTSGALTNWSFVFWIFAFQGMFAMIKDRFPNYAILGFLIAAAACIAGSNFGAAGIVLDAVDGEIKGDFGLGGVLSFYVPGILFPISLLVLSIQLRRVKKINIGLLLIFLLAAICFPISRIGRIEWLAYVDDFLLLITMAFIAREMAKNNISAREREISNLSNQQSQVVDAV